MKFQSTCIPRSADSMELFKIGFFKKLPNHYIISSLPCSNGKTLRFYDYCDRYKRKPIIKAALEDVYQTNIYKDFQKEFSRKVFLYENVTLSGEDIDAMYQICAFNLLLWPKNYFTNNDFCQLFNKKDLAIMEYISDVSIDHKLGHMYKSNKMMAAPLLKHIVKILNKPSNNDDFYMYGEFAHGETVLPIIVFIFIFLLFF